MFMGSISATGAISAELIDDDIIKMLSEISAGSGHEYEMGYDGDKRDIIKAFLNTVKKATGKTAKDLIVEMVSPAEEFYGKLLQLVPKEHIRQHRIGLDYATKIPTTLTVISYKYESKMPEIMDMAADLEISTFRKTNNYCSFWVITDHKLDQYSINHDFPCYKVNV
jgi:NurA-like 5'-3' nuclease